MKPVVRAEITDYQTYNDGRAVSRPKVLAEKERRRIIVGQWFVFLFENRDTVRYQVQEMMRTEKIVREADIQHELDTYNELLHEGGKLGCTLLICIDDPAERSRLLREWRGLVEYLYAEMPDGRKVRPSFDPAQVGDDALSAVQYLTYDLGGVAPVALGVEHPAVRAEVTLAADQRAALQADLDA